MKNEQSSGEWELFALGLLDAEEHEALSRRLAQGDPVARLEYQTALESLHALALSAPDASPSSSVEARLMERLRPERTNPPQPTPFAAWIWQATTAACLVGCAILGWITYQQRQQLDLRQQELAKSHAVAPAMAAKPANPPPELSAPVAPPAATGRHQQSADAAQAAAVRRQLTEAEEQRAKAEQQNRNAQQQLASLEQEQEQLRSEIKALRGAPPAVPSAPGPEEHALQQQLADAEQRVAQLQAEALSERRLLRFLQSGPVQQVDLRSIDAEAGKAHALALYSPSEGLMLFARDLPRLAADKCYQLWALRKANPAIVSVGILKTDETGGGYLYAPASSSLAAITGLSVTDEPVGGSQSAIGRKLLFGALR